MTWWSKAKRDKLKNENAKQGRNYLCCGRLLYLARNSNVHGLRFVVGEKRNILTRLFWLMVIGVSCAGLHVLLEAIMDTVSGATVNFTPDTLYLDWRTTFPAVTICEKYNYRKSLKKLTLLYPDLIEAQDFTRRKYLIDLLYGEGSCKDCEPCGTKIPCEIDWRKMIDSVHKSCPELLSRCSWNGESFDCCVNFLPVDSEKGMCFALNTRQSQMSGSVQLFSSNRTTGPGELVFHALSDVQVSVHSVEELATHSLSDDLSFVVEEYSMYTTEYLFKIVEMENEKELEAQSVEFRACRYLHELPSIPLLYAYQVYAHSTCVLACETQRKFKACGCISPVRDIAYKEHYCNFTGLNCLVKYEESRKLSQVHDLTCQNCLPSCEESELKRIHHRRYVTERMSSEGYQSPPGARVRVRMVALPTLRYERNILRTSLDLVVSVGGIAGLFFGASLLSVVEAFYLICVQRRGQGVDMGNTESNVTSSVKKQAGVSTQVLYKLVDVKGGGLLVDMMKRAAQNKQYAEIDHAIKTKVEPLLYNRGKGRYIPVSQVVLLRNKERPRHKQLPIMKTMENPDEEFDIEQGWPEVTQSEYDANPSGYREICWDLKERGAVGETILHLCLLAASSLHADLAKRLLRFYPKLINDIYMSDEYYGESVLHIAIVNEDPSMVKFLLNAGADYHERCFGNFMCPEDQKASRTDSQDHEWVNVQPITNYEGYVYWGEYPLSFAACLGQEECYRLMLARGANPDQQDTNGNTALHMLVIYEKLSTFDMAYEMGASLSLRNVLNLTPLTLAAKLARIELFFHILNIEREIYWQIGSITCAAYPLSQIDTIDVETGNISKDSALNLVVFGEKDEHLELMDGVLIDLLKTKWNTFVKFRFYRQFIMFTFYFLISLVCFTLRPGPPEKTAVNATVVNATLVKPILVNDTNGNDTAAETLDGANCITIGKHNKSHDVETLGNKLPVQKCEQFKSHSKEKEKATTEVPDRDSDMEDWWDDLTEECRLMNMDSLQAQIRVCAELMLWIGALAYVIAAMREARFLGTKMFFENLSTAPSRVMFLFSCLLMLSLPTLRLSCADEAEDHVAVIIMLTTAPYFLFYCRGFKTVGPFVVMIYRMVMGDLLRFVCIYLVFVMGFSQAYYIIFLSFDNPNTPEGVDDSVSNPMPSPMESVMAMFLMSMTSFGDYYGAFEHTDHEIEAKLLFVVYMIIVAILLVNMLIAMMGNTYQKIAETRNEWQRQWARIVLVVERGTPPAYRLQQLMSYSQPMSLDRRALVLRLNQTDEDKEEMKEILEMKRTHERQVIKRRLQFGPPLPPGTTLPSIAKASAAPAVKY